MDSPAQKTGTNEYNQYLASLHRKFVTPENIIRDVVREGTGRDIVDKQRIIAGEISEVYVIRLTDTTEVILRIARSPYPNFQQEVWAIEQAKQAGVPVPTILLVKYLTVDTQELSFCLMEKLDAEPLERGKIEFGKLDRKEQRRYINEAGDILSRIHSIQTNGYGWIVGKGEAQHTAAQWLIDEWLGKREHFYAVADGSGMDRKYIDQAADVITTLLAAYARIPTVLNHADYGHKHFMVKDGHIVGIIDWGGVRSDIPMYDFSNWDYWFGDYIPTEWLKEGYAHKEIFTSEFDDILHRLRIFKGVEVLDWYAGEKYEKYVCVAKDKLIKDLLYFD